MTFDDQEVLERDPLIHDILIPSEDIQRRVSELGREISSEYRDSVPILVEEARPPAPVSLGKFRRQRP